MLRIVILCKFIYSEYFIFNILFKLKIIFYEKYKDINKSKSDKKN